MKIGARVCLSLLVLAALSLPLNAAGKGIPRTASGKPDLSGNYDISTLTPFERSLEQGDRRAFTKEEVQAIVGGAATRLESQSQRSDPDRNAPEVGGRIGGYNAFWVDRGTAPVFVKGEYRTSLIIDPPNGRLPPLTEKGRARVEGLYTFRRPETGRAWWLDREVGPYDGPDTLSILDRCIFHPEATIPVQPRAYNNLKTIVQTDTHVLLHIEWIHQARIIRLDSEHVPSDMRSRAGDSIGWWEGDTLVVDTTNFLEENWITASITGKASSTSDQHVVERFSLPDAETLLYEFTVESSDYETPYRGEYTWPRTDNKLYEYACHEGNYSMGNTLRGARLQEKETLTSGGQ